MKTATCHPERKYHCMGKCKSCYRQDWYAANKQKALDYRAEYYQQNRLEIREKDRRYRRVHKDQVNHSNREWRKRNPEKYKRQMYVSQLKQYGLTPEAYERMLLSQDGACAICRKQNLKLCIDHDHASGKVRGLLCYACNNVLGCSKDSEEILRKAIEYLYEHGSAQRTEK